MENQVQEVKETTVQGDGVVPKNTVVANTTATSPAFKVEQVVYLILGILEVFLALRIVLSLLGANQNNGFAQLVYSVSAPFAAPFFGLFAHQFQYGESRFEIETIVAMVVYALVAWGIVKLTRIGRS